MFVIAAGTFTGCAGGGYDDGTWFTDDDTGCGTVVLCACGILIELSCTEPFEIVGAVAGVVFCAAIFARAAKIEDVFCAVGAVADASTSWGLNDA